jgi:6-phosphogluconolactonase (cycloisomerase 2 family)
MNFNWRFRSETMAAHPWRSASIVLLGWFAAWAGQALPLVAAGADGGFTLYAPAAAQRRLLVVRAAPAPLGGEGGTTLALVRTVDLEFPGATITSHPTQPLIYVSGAGGPEGRKAAVVPLDEAGLPLEPKPATLEHGYAYLATDRAGRFLLGCDYGSGAVDVFPLDAAGLPGNRVHGIAEGRTRAHCVQPSPDNRSVYVPHVGGESALLQYAFDPATGGLTPLEPEDVGPPADSEPRHYVYHPRLPLVYFSEQKSLGVSVYRRAADGRLSFWQRSRAVPADAPATRMSSSDLEITPDGRHLYAGIRGAGDAPNAIACYAVADDGSLAPRGLVSADRIPWGMTLSPDGRFLAVTGYEVGSLVLYAIAADGSIHRAATLACDKHITDIIAR